MAGPPKRAAVAAGPSARPRRGVLRRTAHAAALAALALAGAAGSAHAQRAVDLLLVLAIDCSYSVNAREYDLQRKGVAYALRDPEIQKAIAAGPNGAIAIAAIQWSDEDSQVLALPWTVIDGPAAADAAASRIATAPRRTQEGATSTSAAIGYATALIARSPYVAPRMIIDVSGDGRSNTGPPIEVTRDAAVARGITVNGLAILNEDPTIAYYFEHTVIGGFGAFMVTANDYPQYRTALQRKMLREIRYVPVSGVPARVPGRG